MIPLPTEYIANFNFDKDRTFACYCESCGQTFQFTGNWDDYWDGVCPYCTNYAFALHGIKAGDDEEIHRQRWMELTYLAQQEKENYNAIFDFMKGDKNHANPESP